ncbi:MAG: hypothetical protein V3S64_17230 [bacterium]
MVIDFLCDEPRNWQIGERYGDDGRVALLHPLFDYPVIVQTYDLLTDLEVNKILENANIPQSDFQGLYGVSDYGEKSHER